MPDRLENIYNQISKDFDTGSYQQFQETMKDSLKVKKVYDHLSQNFDLGEYEEFDQYVKNIVGRYNIATDIGAVAPVGPLSAVPMKHAKSVMKGITGTVKGIGGFLQYVGIDGVGKDVSDFVDNLEKNYLEIEDQDFTNEVAQGFGSAATFFIPGLGVAKGASALATVSPKIAALIGTSVSALMESAVEAGVMYEERIDAGESISTAKNKATQSFALNIPTNFILDKWFFTKFGKRLHGAIIGAANEGAEEYLQELISAFSQTTGVVEGLKEVVKPKTQERALRGAAVGAIVGGGIGMAKPIEKRIDPKNTDLITPRKFQEQERSKILQQKKKLEPTTPMPEAPEIAEAPLDAYVQEVVADEVRQSALDMDNATFAELMGVEPVDAVGFQSQVIDDIAEEVVDDMQEVQQSTRAEILSEGDEDVKKEIEKVQEELTEPPEVETEETLGTEPSQGIGLSEEALREEIGDREGEISVVLPELKSTDDADRYGALEMTDKEVPVVKSEIERLATEIDNIDKLDLDPIDKFNQKNPLTFRKQMLLESLSSKDGVHYNYDVVNGWRQGKMDDYTAQKIKKLKADQLGKIGGGQAFHVPSNETVENVKRENQEESTTDSEVDSYEDSITQEPRASGNLLINQLTNQKIISEQDVGFVISQIEQMVATSPTAEVFANRFKEVYKAGEFNDSDIYAAYRIERESEHMNVIDMDIVVDTNTGKIINTDVNDSYFVDHNGNKLGDKYLINSVLKPIKDKLAIIKIYRSNIWKDKKGRVTPYRRNDSVTSRDISEKMYEIMEQKLNTKGYTLLPVSDSNTFLAAKLDFNKYKKGTNETAGQQRSRLTKLANEISPEQSQYWQTLGIRDLIAELSFNNIMNETIGYWYNPGIESKDLAKRWKMFLPKGEPLEFTRKIKFQIVNDIVAKDKNGKNITRQDTSNLLDTDGNTALNPKFATEFFEHNKLGDIKQHKSFITEKNADFLIGVKHMSHVLSSSDWNRLCKKVGADPSSDMIIFDSAAKIAVANNGQPLEKNRTFEIDPSSIRHIFSGSVHEKATLSRQIFNFVVDNKAIKDIREKIINRRGKEVKETYREFETSPDKLLSKLQQMISDVSSPEITDFRKYVNLGAVFFKSLRSNIKGMLRREQIGRRFIKLQHSGNFSYLRPDYFGEINEGEIYLPQTELIKIAERLNVDPSRVNEKLVGANFEVITSRSPISRADNVQISRVKKVLSVEDGNCVVMNTRDVVLNKEGDFDGDDVFYHYISKEDGTDVIANEVRKNVRPVKEIYVKENDSGSGAMRSNRIASAVAAGVGKRVIGEASKAVSMKSILVANNVSLVELPSGDYVIAPKNVNMDLAKKIFPLKKDLSEWEEKMAVTTQAGVDNLKNNSLKRSKVWMVKDGEVDYNRREIYADLFEGNPDPGSVNDALFYLSNTLNLFTRNFDIGGTWTQDQINRVATEYIEYIDGNNILGESIHEEMIREMANMGYMPLETDVVYDIPHDVAYDKSVSDFKKRHVDNESAKRLSDSVKKKIENKVLELYQKKKALEVEYGRNISDIYTPLYDEYRSLANDFKTQDQRDYWDFVTIRGYTVYKDGGYKVKNTRFILGVVSDENIRKFSNIFNEHYSREIEKNKPAFSIMGLNVPEPTIKNPDNMLRRALHRFFGRTYTDISYGLGKRQYIPYLEALDLVNDINKTVYEIGRLPFSDAVPIEELYRYTIEFQRGKSIDDPWTAADGVAIMQNLRELKHNLKTGDLNKIFSTKWFHFTEDVLRKNIYTQKYVKELLDATSEKDTNAEHFTKMISNRRFKADEGVRELLDLQHLGLSKFKTMNDAMKVLDKMNYDKYYGLTGQLKKKERNLKAIEKKMIVQGIAQQIEIVEDVIKALDGQIGTSSDVQEKTRQVEQFILDKYGKPGKEIFKAYQKGRQLLDEVLVWDMETWDNFIGDPDEPGTWQYERMSTLRTKLQEHGYANSDIENAIKVLTVHRPKRWENYYPHQYLEGYHGRDGEDISGWEILNKIEELSANDLSDRIKTISAWKHRSRETQNLEDMANRNLISVLSSRVDASINARWANRFRKIYTNMISSLNEGIKKEINKGDGTKVPESIKTLEQVRGVVDSMYSNVSTSQDFGYWRSMSNMTRGLLLSNLLLFSTKGFARNASQGVIPNLINFGASKFADGVDFHKNNKGIITLEDGTRKNVYESLGIGRADIFAKIEGGLEWDVYKTMEKAQEFNLAMQSGEVSKKAKNYVKSALMEAETRMNKFTKVVGENNVFTFMWGLGKKFTTTTYNKIVPKGKQIPIPEMPSTTASYSGIEYWNRKMTAAMAFTDMWNRLRKSGVPLNERAYNIAVKYAQDMINKTQFNYNMWNRPIALRKAPTLFQFKSFTLGMLKLHWKWATEVGMAPSKNLGKVVWFSILAAITAGLEEYMRMGFWRFFELPELEYASNFAKWIWGDRDERKWAWYGNRLSPITGPIGGMLWESLIAMQIIQENKSRRNLAWYRMFESIVPGVRELNEIYARIARIFVGQSKFETEIIGYFGLYPIWEPKKRDTKWRTFRKPEHYEGPIRELLQDPSIILDDPLGVPKKILIPEEPRTKERGKR